MSKPKENKPRKRPVVPENETKEEKYKRIAPPKVKSALKYIRKIAYLTGNNRYEMTEEQVLKIVDLLHEESQKIFEAFTKRNEVEKEKEEIEFSL